MAGTAVKKSSGKGKPKPRPKAVKLKAQAKATPRSSAVLTVKVLLPDAAAEAIMAATQSATPGEAAKRLALMVREIELPPKRKTAKVKS